MHPRRIFQALRQGHLPPVGELPGLLLDGLAVAASLRGRVATLSSTERILATIRHKEPDRVPVTPLLCSAARQITLLGYLPTSLLVEGTPMEVMEACKRQIDDLAKGGGFILAPGCEYPPNLPLGNAFAMGADGYAENAVTATDEARRLLAHRTHGRGSAAE